MKEFIKSDAKRLGKNEDYKLYDNLSNIGLTHILDQLYFWFLRSRIYYQLWKESIVHVFIGG